MSASVHDAYDLARAGYHVTPNYVPTEDGCSCGCADLTCRDRGKHPIGGADKHATADPQAVRAWTRTYRKHGFNLGINLKASDLVDISSDSPEWQAEFERRGLPDGALVWDSPSGRHHAYRRPADCPQTKINEPGKFDLLAIGMACAPPSVSGKGAYTWVSDRIIPRDELPEAPAWAVAMLREVGAAQEESRTDRSATGWDGPPAALAPVVDGCAWLRHCRDDAATLGEPEWYAMLSIIPRTEGGEALAHAWSKPHPGYTKEATDNKIAHALKDAGPRSCANIKTGLGAEECDGCPNWGKVTSPIVLAQPTGVLVAHAPLAADAPCSDQVAALQAEVTYWKDRAVRAEGMVEELREIQITRLALRRNKHLKTVAPTVEALANEYASVASREQPNKHGRYVIRRARLAENSGRSKDTVSDHLDWLEDRGFVRKEAPTNWYKRINTATGEVEDLPQRDLEVSLCAPATPGTDSTETTIEPLAPSEWIKHVTAYEAPEDARTHGGKRARCPLHPKAKIVRKRHCGVCDADLEPEESLSRQDDVEGDATTPPADPSPAPVTPIRQDDAKGAPRRRQAGDPLDGWFECVHCGWRGRGTREICGWCERKLGQSDQAPDPPWAHALTLVVKLGFPVRVTIADEDTTRWSWAYWQGWLKTATPTARREAERVLAAALEARRVPA